MAEKPTRLPQGNDPRLKVTPDDLDAASTHAMPQVARASSVGEGVGIAAGIIGVAALGLITFLSVHNSPKPVPAPAPVVQPPLPQPHYTTLPPINPDIHPLEPAPIAVQPVAPTPAAAPAVDPNAKSPAMIIDNSVTASSSTSASPAAGTASTLNKTLNANDQFLAAQNSDVSQKASKIGDPSQVVPQGAIIPAVLETAINSDLPGYTRAIVSRDIRSFDGSTVLIPRGSHLIGQYKSGLASGETRAFIIWNRLIRPDGVSVELASPATDDLGQAGMSGKVDSHFVKRFGSAILLSIVNGLATAIGGQSGSNTIVIGTSTEAQGVVSDALSNDAKIPPTITVAQGTNIEVFAARDLDFALGH